MKRKVVLDIPDTDFRWIDSVDSEHYYGVQYADHSNGKGFITRSDYFNGKYIALCTNHLTKGNSWTQFSGNTVRELLLSMSKSDCFEIFEFDSSAELLLWLVKS